MGRKQYYFNPFQSRDDKEIASTLEKYTQKSDCTIVNSDDELGKIEDDATLLIDGHAKAGEPALYSKKADHSAETIKASTLAMRIQTKLPKSHIKIRVLACWGGSNAPQHTVGAAGSSFACALAFWLGQFQFRKIAVGGYLHGTFTYGKGRTLINLEDGVVENKHDSGYVRWYGDGGAVIVKPSV